MTIILCMKLHKYHVLIPRWTINIQHIRKIERGVCKTDRQGLSEKDITIVNLGEGGWTSQVRYLKGWWRGGWSQPIRMVRLCGSTRQLPANAVLPSGTQIWSDNLPFRLLQYSVLYALPWVPPCPRKEAWFGVKRVKFS